ncbi:glycosyltransferase family 2 protein [Deinococcus marmoris]|uniref:glycosyltransferase family 2 protein n=1 Tax=Deinococcus marmoris TaxID=249408 RepID=UPI0009E0B166|nr:glycosyltransferase family 2 protein [Deinococcus marmoris]
MIEIPEKIDIVLATYNGERYLNQQIRSLLDQTVACNILCHDDGSSDATEAILQRYMLAETRFKVISHHSLGGASQNFSFLLENSGADYVLCSDQDDIWLPDKIERLMEAMLFYESVYGSDMPLLVHSDLAVIDNHGKLMDRSFWSYQHLNPKWGDQFNLILTQNIVTGCSMLVNRSLLNKSLPIPTEAIMHDWWLALVACSFGKIIWIPEATVLYRQHSENAVGAKRFDTRYIASKLSTFGEMQTSLNLTAAQATVFAKNFPTSPHATQAKCYAQLPEMTYWQRRQTIMRERFFKVGTLRNLAWIGLI